MDGLFDSFHALLHALVGLLLQFLVLALKDLTAISQFLDEPFVLGPEGLYFRGELLVEESQLLPTVLLSIAFVLLLPYSRFELAVFGLELLDCLGQLRALLGDMSAFGLCFLQHFLQSLSRREYLRFSVLSYWVVSIY